MPSTTTTVVPSVTSSSMPSTAVTTLLMPVSAYTEESPTPAGSTFLKTVIRGLQMACLAVIPIFAVSLIMFMSVMAVRCDGSGGFVMTRDGTVHCVAATSGGQETQHGRESRLAAARLGADMQTGHNGTVVMTVTRVVLISVSVLIFSFTAWICVWYQRYGKGNANDPGQELQVHPLATVPTTSDEQMMPVLTIRVNDYLAKEDMERLLGPDHSAAPAV